MFQVLVHLTRRDASKVAVELLPEAAVQTQKVRRNSRFDPPFVGVSVTGVEQRPVQSHRGLRCHLQRGLLCGVERMRGDHNSGPVHAGCIV